MSGKKSLLASDVKWQQYRTVGVESSREIHGWGREGKVEVGLGEEAVCKVEEELSASTARARARATVWKEANSEPGMKEDEEPQDPEICQTRKWKCKDNT